MFQKMLNIIKYISLQNKTKKVPQFYAAGIANDFASFPNLALNEITAISMRFKQIEMFI